MKFTFVFHIISYILFPFVAYSASPEHLIDDELSQTTPSTVSRHVRNTRHNHYFPSLHKKKAPEQDHHGWVALERPEQAFDDFLAEENDDTWVVFSKKMANENIVMRFLKDPEYRQTETGVLFHAADDGQFFHLHIEPKSIDTPASFFAKKTQHLLTSPEITLIHLIENEDATADYCYQINDTYIWEHVIASPAFFYTLHTESVQKSDALHRQLIASFYITP